MRNISMTELQRSMSAVCDTALRGPIGLTRFGQRRLVLLPVEDYEYLKRLEELNTLSNEGVIATALNHASKEVKERLLRACNELLGIAEPTEILTAMVEILEELELNKMAKQRTDNISVPVTVDLDEL